MTVTGSIQQKNKIIINMYAPNIKAFLYTNIDRTEERNINALIDGDINTSFSIMDISIRQKIQLRNKELEQRYKPTDICGTFHLMEAEYTFFSSAHGIFSRIEN